ncbi:mechanosensitive ion channel family protein [Serratia aquatilis]|uniref:Mechanosensitive ion channel family protein n=1 Tax=Serratia aquatilis TaxID=1737515 RepID=A0ABV6E9F6_9GAMM
MDSEFVSNNILSVSILAVCIIGVIGLAIYERERERGKFGFIVHLAQFVLWVCIITILGGYAEIFVVQYKISFISSSSINFFCTTIISLILIRKLFLMINRLEKKQIKLGRDLITAHIISRILKVTIIVIMMLLYGEHFGMSVSGLVTFGGIGGIAIGMAGKEILSNFFSGIMLYFDRPFDIGDWIRSPDRNIEGTVAEIGWRMTRITTFDQRPLYIPNSIFSSISVENPGRMANRRIETSIGLRYEDSSKIGAITRDIRAMLKADENIDLNKSLLVYFNMFGDSSLNIMIYCFTKTTVWSDWLAVQQEVYLKIIDIVHQHGADFAFPSSTLYFENQQQKMASAALQG